MRHKEKKPYSVSVFWTIFLVLWAQVAIAAGFPELTAKNAAKISTNRNLASRPEFHNDIWSPIERQSFDIAITSPNVGGVIVGRKATTAGPAITLDKIAYEIAKDKNGHEIVNVTLTGKGQNPVEFSCDATAAFSMALVAISKHDVLYTLFAKNTGVQVHPAIQGSARLMKSVSEIDIYCDFTNSDGFGLETKINNIQKKFPESGQICFLQAVVSAPWDFPSLAAFSSNGLKIRFINRHVTTNASLLEYVQKHEEDTTIDFTESVMKIFGENDENIVVFNEMVNIHRFFSAIIDGNVVLTPTVLNDSTKMLDELQNIYDRQIQKNVPEKFTLAAPESILRKLAIASNREATEAIDLWIVDQVIDLWIDQVFGPSLRR